MKYFTYGLVDPRNNKIRYIGRTYNVKLRLIAHLDKTALKPNTYKNNWIKKLLKLKLKPKLRILAISNNYRNSLITEKRLISLYSKKYSLTNGTTGGEGWPKGTPIKVTKKRLKSYKRLNKKVICRNLITQKEIIFNSVKECAIFLKTWPSTISLCLKNNYKVKSIKKHHIRYFGTEFISPIWYDRIYQVKKTCLKTGKIKIYKDITEVEKDGFQKKPVRDVCVSAQKRQSHKGFKWEYIK